MEIEIATIGGYEEVGRQMTAVRAGDDVVIFDMGLDLSRVLLQEHIVPEEMHSLDLIEAGAIPDDRVMSELDGEVQAIVPTHGHLDHIGGIPKLAHRYQAPIVATPFTAGLVKQQFDDERKFDSDNSIKVMDAGETMSVGESGELELEFVNVTHSIIDAINPVLHTPEGAVVYGLDKRIDNTPILGDPIDIDRFEEIAATGTGVLAYIEDCTNAEKTGRTPSERVAREQLRDVMYNIRDYEGGILATTFSSHIARVKSIVEFADDIGRQPLLLGRSMESYSSTAEELGLVDLPDDLGMYGHRDSVDQALSRVMEDGKEDYLPIVTGHQGEPRAMLTRMARGETPYDIESGDKVIFSARVIPEPTNVGQRHRAEELLSMQGARVYDDVHVSGHLRQEGLYQMLDILQPQHVIPAHQSASGYAPYVNLAESEGYEVGRDLHISRNGNVITIVDT